MAGHQQPTTELYVIGPSSTGKTTLCNALARSLALAPWCYITQVARRVMRSQGFTRDDVGNIEMQSAIMVAQLEQEKAVSAKARATGERLVLSDRSGIDPIVYAVLTATDERQAQQRKGVLLDDPTFQIALERYRAAEFLLLRPVSEWLVDDGVRTLEQHARCFQLYRAVLAELEIPYREIGEEMKELPVRVEWVRRWITTVPVPGPGVASARCM